MEKFTVHTGVGVPLRRSNVDTDQIIPAVYLKRVTRTGFEDGLFAAWRADPEFVLNAEPYRNGSVLVAGPDFGTGSSREHAVWALKDYGFRVVLSSRFADIFRGNSGKQGLLTGLLSQHDVERIWELLEAAPGTQVSVDLAARRVLVGDFTTGFQVDDYTRWRLMEGLDDVGLTLQHAGAIAEGMVIDAASMRRNLDLTGGLIVAEAVMMGLAPLIGRGEAHHVVKHACDTALAEHIPLADALARDPAVASRLDRVAIERLTDPAHYLGSADAFIDRVREAARRVS